MSINSDSECVSITHDAEHELKRELRRALLFDLGGGCYTLYIKSINSDSDCVSIKHDAEHELRSFFPRVGGLYFIHTDWYKCNRVCCLFR